MATDVSAEGPVTHKAKAVRELDETLAALEQSKVEMNQEIKVITKELEETMTAIKSLGLLTLRLEAELQESWDLVKKSKAEADGGAEESPEKPNPSRRGDVT